MLISLLPRVTGMKIENSWGRGMRGLVRCTARLSRPLRAKEWERLDRFPGTNLEGSEVVHECRPEDVEEWHARLVDVLRGEWAPAERRAARAAEPKARRRERKRDAGRRPDTA
jgi:hypothetical protein